MRLKNERSLRRLFQRAVLVSTPITLALGSAACGGSTEPDTFGDGTGQGGSAGSGSGGKSSGGAGATSGSTGSGGAGATGTGGVGAAGGSIAAGGVGATGSGGAAGTGATAGTAQGGAGGAGGTESCSAPPKDCLDSVTVTMPLDCVSTVTEQLPSAECASLCPVTAGFAGGNCTVTAHDSTSVTINCSQTCFVGRRPEGLSLAESADVSLGAYFAGVAALEAASVLAFRQLRDELRPHRAPKRLLAALGRAARDEIRHARSTRALARRFGKASVSLEVAPRPKRSLEAIALENVREGCVRETFGALLAHHHAAHALSPHVRATMQRIARDETRHAAASWAVQRWLESRLDRSAQSRVRAARTAAIHELSCELGQPTPNDPERLAGFPSRETALSLLESVASELWS